jgi:hypothetical protein
MNAQLTLFAASPSDPKIEWMESTLLAVGDWMSASELSSASGGRLDDRAIRALAGNSDNVVSGQLGYKHIRRATTEEIDHAATWLESQSRKMAERATRIRRNAHQLVG